MPEELTQEQIREFVLAAHGNFAKVQELLEKDGRYLNARFHDFDENGLEAASHVGNRAIAEYLLGKGAPLTICAAAMLGRLADVQAFLEADPTLANSAGSHGISLLYHAAQCGDTAVTDLLIAHGNTQDPSHPLHGAVAHNRPEMVRWLLARGADREGKNWQEKTPLQVAQEGQFSEIIALLES